MNRDDVLADTNRYYESLKDESYSDQQVDRWLRNWSLVLLQIFHPDP